MRVNTASLAAWPIVLLSLGTIARPSPVAAQNTVKPLSLEVIRNQCIEFKDVKPGNKPGDYRECRISEFGEFGAVDGRTYFYALYCLIPSESDAGGKCGYDSFVARYHRSRALAVFSRDPSNGNVQLVFERADPDFGSAYDKPQMIQNAAGTLLQLSIDADGTGHFNESEYYLRNAGRWERIESEAWLNDLRKRLPNGLEIWKGVWPDLGTMRAEAGLYRAGDANCCPTGGIARIQLAIRARRLVLVSVVVDKNP